MGGILGPHPTLVKRTLAEAGHDPVNPTRIQLLAAQTKAADEFLATAFMLLADRSRYGRLIEDLENQFTQGIDNYPKTLNAAYSLLNHWKQDPQLIARMLTPVSESVSFAQKTGTHPSDIKCYSCKGTGHISTDPICPNYDKKNDKPEGGGLNKVLRC